jgi:predicted transposase YbfD/YdcC
MPSSRIDQFAREPLPKVLARVPDPRDPRGVRHQLAAVLTLAQAAVLTGARSLVAIAEWIADTDREVLAGAGIDPDRPLPSESAIRRTLARVDADDLDVRLSGWMVTRIKHAAGRRVIAIDGKTMRGARTDTSAAPHLVAALDHDAAAVVGQLAIDDKSNEIPALCDLIDTMDVAGAVITADAMHCQTSTARHIAAAGAAFALTVKDNQPSLRAACKALPWKTVPAVSDVDNSHGRRVRRTVRAVQAPDWIEFPGARQIVQIRRTRNVKGRKTTEVVYVICSLDMAEAQPRQVASWIRGHWRVENSLHWVRDVTYDEDRHQLRVGKGPQVMASLRNASISLIRLSGRTKIAATLRYLARQSSRPVDLLLTI